MEAIRIIFKTFHEALLLCLSDFSVKKAKRYTINEVCLSGGSNGDSLPLIITSRFSL